jgi:hypothetical protein
MLDWRCRQFNGKLKGMINCKLRINSFDWLICVVKNIEKVLVKL